MSQAEPAAAATRVSIPYSAGLWLLVKALRDLVAQYNLVFQSPILRGSGCWDDGEQRELEEAVRFNPLFCGAQVAG